MLTFCIGVGVTQRVSMEHSITEYLGSSSDHVLDEIIMSRCIDDGDVIFFSLKLPELDVGDDGDATLTLHLQLVQNPGVLERTLPYL